MWGQSRLGSGSMLGSTQKATARHVAVYEESACKQYVNQALFVVAQHSPISLHASHRG